MIEVGTKWNDCIKVYDLSESDDLLYDDDWGMDIFHAFNTYKSVIQKEPRTTVWYDTIDNKCFGDEQTFYQNPNEFSFFAEADEFLDKKNRLWGLKHIAERFVHVFGEDLHTTKEFIYNRSEFFRTVKNKSILFIGAGPSAIDFDCNTVECDQIWTCNNYYLSEVFEDVKVDLVSLGPNVNLKDERLVSRINNDGTVVSFEAGVSPFRSDEDLYLFNRSIKNDSLFSHTRYFSKLGTIVRQMCLASFLGAKKIMFIGVDGYPIGQEHAFEGDKKIHDRSHYAGDVYDIHRRQYILYWEYMYNLFIKEKKLKYINLGQGGSASQMSEITAELL